ncbi:MAG: thrombospondin type 3 repeat-containing protein, partial [Myxococcota bacterium]|nr:thrombospondin type 3 repeat-containing protein [Myxococcota bacterium]
MRTWLQLLCLGLALWTVACSGEPFIARSAGETCEAMNECESNLCFSQTCLEPEADDDLDGLTNTMEALLGTDPTQVDTDGDGLSDFQEIGSVDDPKDADEDGIYDALESSITDGDNDCLSDQQDNDHLNPPPDTAALWDAACCCTGLCSKLVGSDGEIVTVTNANACDPDAPPGTGLECVLSDPTINLDSDTDGIDDLCDPCPHDPNNDPDHDQVCNEVDPEQTEQKKDNCPEVYNPQQDDLDGDDEGDLCDDDLDGDGTPNEDDNCPEYFNPLQEDTDDPPDGIGNACDDD